MITLFTLARSVVSALIVFGLGHCAAEAQNAAVTNPASDGKTIYDCFRGITGPPDTEKGWATFKQVHGGTSIWGGYAEGAHKAGIFTFPITLHGWICPKVPDWSIRKSDGSLLDKGQYVCWNSPYKEYAVTNMVDYVKKNAVDGFLLDAFWWGIMGNDNTDWCCCDYCKKAYRDRFGQEMPLNPAWANPRQMKQCIEWRRDSLKEVYTKVRAAVKAARPEVAINIHGGPSWHQDAGNLFSSIACQRLSDIAYFENYHNEIFYAAFLRGVSQRRTMAHVPYLSDAFHAHDPIARYNDGEMNAVASGLVAHGVIPVMYVRWNPDGSLSKSYVSLLEPIYREIEEKEPYLIDASPIHYAAIVYSEAVKTCYRRDNPQKSILPHLEGAFETFQRLHVPVEFILAELDLNLETLKKFKVVVLPNTAILSPPQVEVIRQYVKEGGSILATYETSLYDDVGEQKADFDLADVLGLKYVETRSGEWQQATADGQGNYLAPQGTFLKHLQELLAPRQNQSLHMAGPAIITRAIAGVSRATLVPWEGMSPYVKANQTNIPGVHVNTYGKGKAAYISTPIFKLIKIPQITDNDTFPKKSYPMAPFARKEGWVVDLTRELLNELAPNPSIRVEGQRRLECTFFEQKEKNRLIVHLLNSIVREVGEVYPTAPAKILVKKDFLKPSKAYSAWPERKDLAIQDKGDYLEFTTPGTRIHQIVVIERAE